MDHSQHSIQNHGAHDHAAMEASASTIISPMMDLINPTGAGMHDHQSMHSGHDMGSASGGIVGDMGSTMHHMMSMSFHFGCDETILFSWWKIDDALGLIASMLAIFVMALLYEGLKYYRELLFWKTYNLLEYRPVTGPPQRNPEEAQQHAAPSATTSPMKYFGGVIHKQPPKMFSRIHFYQTLLHILQVTLSFMLMLIFMTYNVWLCMAVVLGAAVGYFVFCWKKSVIVDVTEHCH